MDPAGEPGPKGDEDITPSLFEPHPFLNLSCHLLYEVGLERFFSFHSVPLADQPTRGSSLHCEAQRMAVLLELYSKNRIRSVSLGTAQFRIVKSAHQSSHSITVVCEFLSVYRVSWLLKSRWVVPSSL